MWKLFQGFSRFVKSKSGLSENFVSSKAGKVGLVTAFGVPVIGAPLFFQRLFRSENQDVPGEKTGFASKLAEATAGLLQSKRPLSGIHMYLHGVHLYNSEPKRQLEAHHYCSHVNEDFQQCLIYDSNETDAKLIGVEYVISEKLFDTLPAEEQQLWHSHASEVKTGVLTSPALPYSVEHKVMEQLAPSYGKTWHFWQVDRTPDFPYGVPQLMGSAPNEDLLDNRLIEERDKRLGISTLTNKANREDIPTPRVHPNADHWFKTGQGIQLEIKYVPVRGLSMAGHVHRDIPVAEGPARIASTNPPETPRFERPQASS